MSELKLLDFRKKSQNSDFTSLFEKLILNKEISDEEIQYLLKTAIFFLNFGDTYLQKLGYKILVVYSNRYNDYKPLYDFAINKGFIPISKFIESKNSTEKDSFFEMFFSAFHENFKEQSYYLSNGQKKLTEFSNSSDKNLVIIAPTSYGKSEIIIKKILDNLNKKICVIVPSKALLAQTKKRLLNQSISDYQIQRVITHPEMYKGTEESFISVLTQERLLRLLQKNEELSLDLILIDEAHNIFGDKKDDERAILLAQVVIILKKRNPNISLNFYSPFIADFNNLKINQIELELESENIDEFIKTEKYFICDLRNGKNQLELYDQFSNQFFNTNIEYEDIFDLLLNENSKKNIIYLNRPMHIEELSNDLMDKIEDTFEIDDIEETISDFIHPNYKLINCIKKGIVYHHGGMPEMIRLYVEDIFSKYNFISFIITSSTLLEGINIPAEKIFLLSIKKGKNTNLTNSQFKNLIGRVNRFSEIFNNETGDLRLLEPNIYILKNKYTASNANIKNFVSQRARIESQIEDNINNVLLKTVGDLNIEEKEILKNSLESLENIEPNTTDLENPYYVQSEIAKLCYKNNINDFDIKTSEKQLIENLNNYKRQLFSIINNSNDLIEAIASIFFNEIDLKDSNISRLVNPPARRFYSMLVEWRSRSASYKEMISSFLRYWETLRGEDLLIYVGTKWGVDKRSFTDRMPLYIDLRNKDIPERVNIAILRIKEEQDFIEFNLLKYIEVLSELELVDHTFFDKVKYGSGDRKTIILLKNGFSIELAKCINKEEYNSLISFNLELDEVNINPAIISTMEENFENKILIFELKYHISFS
ncbi:DEAD/DEAH box helicase [Epilithonimonas caeni]|uniref:DEAD/DEAH box helicase n=1 Tax=Epilithonimonas caeni TaxID=365343 RepID=UPI000415356B|nr:DEAD/DEAH box helicase [Epilithonimonas caeni]